MDSTTRIELRYAGTLSSVIALRVLGLFMLLPVFTVLAQNVPGYSPMAAGLAVGIYGLTQALLQQPFGWLSDRIGRRPMLLVGLAIFALGGCIAAMADSMQWIVFGRALQGCGAIAGVAMAFAADLTRPEKRPVIMAILGIGIGLAFLISIILAVPLSTLLGLSGLFWLTAIMGVVGMMLVFTLPRGTPEQAIPQEPSSMVVSATWLLSFSVFVLHLVMTLLFVVLPPMLVGQFDFDLSSHWQIYLPAMVVSTAFVLPLLRRAGRQASEHRLMPAAFLGLGIALACIPLQSGLAMIGVLVTVYFLCFSLLESAMPSLLSRLAGSRGRGGRLGRYTSFQFLGAFAGGLSGGALWASVGTQGALMIAATLCALWGGVITVLTKRVFLTRGSD